MKKVKFEHYLSNYEVYLGNGFVFKFSSEKKVKKFLAQATSAITDYYYQLNFCYDEMRKLYTDTINQVDDMQLNGIVKAKIIVNQINSVQEKFIQVTNNVGKNSHYFNFSQLTYIVNTLIDSCLMMRQLFENKKQQYMNVRRLKNMIVILNDVRRRIADYGIDSENLLSVNDVTREKVTENEFLKLKVI